MTQEEDILWQKIEDFSFDNEGATLTFAKRVARENGWTDAYGQQVIREYKKFLFLCCISPTTMTPSDPVDQVWHLHLTYTSSYWKDLCKNTLSRELHHNPTEGGQKESEKFYGYYCETLRLYKETFGTKAPEDIWHPPLLRFADTNFQRVNMGANYIISREFVRTMRRRTVVIVGGIALVSAAIFLQMLFFLIIIFIFIAIGYSITYAEDNLHVFEHGKRHYGSGCGGCSCSDSGCGGDGCGGCGGCGD